MSTRSISSRAIVFPSTGNPHEILTHHSYSLPDTPSRNSILVKFLAAPINPADLNQIEGVYPSKAKFQPLPGKDGDWAVGGNEGVVKIIAVGDSVKQEGIETGRWAIMKSTAFGRFSRDIIDDRDLEDSRGDESRCVITVAEGC
jgi:mitochondrial enoyl-[acyl-carrier protein] reductase / trans-2-enoyl-CoA reductase